MSELANVLKVIGENPNLIYFFLTIIVLILIFVAVVIYFITNSFLKPKIDEKVTEKLGKDWETNLANQIDKAIKNKEELISSLVESYEKEQFKKMNILLLNDNGTIQDIGIRVGLRNLNRKELTDNATSLKNYDIAIVYLDNDDDKDKVLLEYREKFLKGLSCNAIVIIYIEGGFINLKNLEEFNYVTTNSTYTLIERLHTSYSIRNIIKND